MDPSNYYSPIPGQPPTYQKKILSALMGDDPSTLPLDPNALPPGSDMPGQTIPTTGVGNGQTTTSTTQPTKSEVPDPNAASSSSSTYDTTGLDPNNPIDAVFIKNKYKQNGVGSGFGDLQYWRAHPDQAARLDADQQGHGTDMPGPGDTGNTSFDPNYGKGGGSGASFGVNPLSYLSGGQNAQDPMDTIMARILAALNQYGGG